jgi:hypothetical protein
MTNDASRPAPRAPHGGGGGGGSGGPRRGAHAPAPASALAPAPPSPPGADGAAGEPLRRPMFESDEEDYAAYDDPLYATDSFRVGCFK